ncbi:MAG: cob(I)yrinic acid a,c-diamide adenosyltransferase [Deltaproteobacteria bacterium]|jgi:cob(I)alamin adenosyltransferase|nr:cob(I)yrinic acid a,c-diamide adenosyltransferase [Deltaproteobacteria bacterium]MBP1717503.1 cob(I)yrinic acid a,c-diamide adenosyltransferase [Deltaproteobacteria bacterium]
MMKFSKKGDRGFTSLIGGQRILKSSPRPETYGTLDEAASALGLAKASASKEKTREIISRIQKDLLVLGAELATAPEDRERFPRRIAAKNADFLERLIAELQEKIEIQKEFILPGETLSGAAMDLSRAIIRRAERKAVGLFQEKIIDNGEILRFLNRLADLLFVLARFEETR